MASEIHILTTLSMGDKHKKIKCKITINTKTWQDGTQLYHGTEKLPCSREREERVVTVHRGAGRALVNKDKSHTVGGGCLTPPGQRGGTQWWQDWKAQGTHRAVIE